MIDVNNLAQIVRPVCPSVRLNLYAAGLAVVRAAPAWLLPVRKDRARESWLRSGF
jgi:hypothetical protein